MTGSAATIRQLRSVLIIDALCPEPQKESLSQLSKLIWMLVKSCDHSRDMVTTTTQLSEGWDSLFPSDCYVASVAAVATLHFGYSGKMLMVVSKAA